MDKVYVLIDYHDYEGYGEPLIFSSLSNARKHFLKYTKSYPMNSLKGYLIQEWVVDNPDIDVIEHKIK